MGMPQPLNRREFLARSTLAGTAAVSFGVWSSRSVAESSSPNEKLNIACVGTANQARFSMGNLRSENNVAVCDIDDRYLDQAVADFPRAKRYNDFRKMLDEMSKEIDAVTVCTPDHIHAPASMMAMRLGKH